MKKIILTLLISAAALSVQAQADAVQAKNVSVVTDLETVEVSFTAEIGRKAAPAGTTLVYAPVLTDGQYKVSLPVVVVQSGRAAKNWARHEWAASLQITYENGIYTRNGRSVDYAASVAFQPWMHDARIDIETVSAGCCDTRTQLLTLVTPILPSPEPIIIPEPEPEPEIIIPEPTLSEYLAEAFPFVLPASDFDENEPIRFYNDERDNALTVYYHLNRYDIDRNYAGNGQTLINLITAIDLIRESGDADVKRVVVAGFASPEGPFDLNDRLAWERAVSVKEFVLKNSDMQDADIFLFNGSADWRGLRMLVAGDRFVPAQAEVLNIIDNHPVSDRIAGLRALEGGATYRYLTESIFPKLRNGAFIRVYFEEKQ